MMTMSQKIIAAHSGMKKVEPGQIVHSKLDLVMSNDISFPVAIGEFNRAGFTEVFNPSKIVLVMDHFTPNKDIISAENCRICREFALEKKINNFFDVGRVGIEHVLLPEQGFVAPGEMIIGGDSHTCTYGALGAFSTGVGSTDVAASVACGETWIKVPAAIKFNVFGELKPWVSGKDVILYIIGKIGVGGALYKSMEFVGWGLRSLSMDFRFTMANMAIEAGAKNCIFDVDDITLEYVNERVAREFNIYHPDDNANYEKTYDINLSDIVPMVALPHLPSNSIPVSEVGDVPIQSVLIGSCTNGRLSDLEAAAKILDGKRVNLNVRTLIIPATQAVYKEAIRRGYIEIFIDAGCAVSTPTCGPCAGGHMGLMGKGERILSTTNRNFMGRMGHIESEIYLSSPSVAAASAIAGKIVSPNEV